MICPKLVHAKTLFKYCRTCISDKKSDGSNSRKEELVLVGGLIRYLTHYDVRR